MDRKKKHHFRPAPPAIRLRRRPPLARGAGCRSRAQQQPAVAARSKVQRGNTRLDMRLRMGDGSASGVSWCEALGSAGSEKRGGRFQTGFHRRKGAKYSAAARTSPMGHAGVSLVKREYRLATTGRGNGRRDGRQLQVTQDAGHHRLRARR